MFSIDYEAEMPGFFKSICRFEYKIQIDRRQDTDLKVRLLEGQVAKRWMAENRNTSAWRQLHFSFGNNNAYISEEFVRVWYSCYEGPYQLILLIQEDDRGKLTAIMPLAQRGRKITGAGDYHAEYQGWLCSEDESASFLDSSLSEIARQLPGTVVSLRYVLPENSRNAIKEVVERIPTAYEFLHSRPLLKLDSDLLSEALRKKGNRSKLNRLKKLGELELVRITNIRDFDHYMTDVVAAYDFRQGYVNGNCPFLEDDRKLRFHRDWFEICPHHIELSILLLNDKPIAAFFGVNVGRTVANAIVAHVPIHAAHSVSKIQIYMFAQELAESNVRFLDLTPGGDSWKNRFATRREEVSELFFYVSAMQAHIAKIRQSVAGYIKRMLAVVGITPNQARAAMARFPTASKRFFRNQVAAVFGDTTELRIYRVIIADRPARDLKPAAKRNSLTDLLAYDQGPAQSTRDMFLAQASYRMSRGEIVYTVRTGDQLAHYSWVNPCQTSSYFTAVDYEYQYPEPGAVLHDFFTHPAYRQQGHCQRTVTQILNALAAQEDRPNWAYISILADNRMSRHVIEKMGFEHTESIIRTRRWSRSIHRVVSARDHFDGSSLDH